MLPHMLQLILRKSTKMIMTWADFRALIDSQNIHFYKFAFGDYYSLIGYDGNIELRCDILFGSSEDTEYLASYAAKAGRPQSPKTTVKSIPKVAVYEPEGFFKSFVTHNLCDKTTWFQQSTEVTGETLTQVTPPLGLIYSFANQNVIDLEHGKITGETDYSLDFSTGQYTETLRDQYRVRIYDNGVELSSGYAVDYAAGTVSFTSLPTGPVTADYHYAGSSKYVLAAPAGKVLQIRHVEIQFTKNLTFVPIVQDIRVYNPNDLPNKMTVEYIAFQNEWDVINIGNQGKGEIPQYGALGHDVLVFPFAYGRTIDLASSVGSEIALSLKDDVAMGGDWATITFYTTQVDE